MQRSVRWLLGVRRPQPGRPTASRWLATPFGLATGLFTNRLGDALAAAQKLEVGGVHVNETSSSRVDLMPYGGSKDSGFGREGPRYAVHEMTEERVVTFTTA